MKKILAHLCIVLLFSTQAQAGYWLRLVAGTGETLLLSDDFERSDSSNMGADWHEALGDIEISSGSAVGATVSSANIAVMADNPNIANGYIVFTANRGASDLARPGVVFRYTDTNNYSLLYFLPWDGDFTYRKIVAGTAITNVVGTCVLSQGTPVEVKVVFDGTSVTADCGNNSSNEISETDSSPVTGNMGLNLKEGSTLSAMVDDWNGYSL